MLIGSFSPLVKIFQSPFDKELETRLLENPDLVFDEKWPEPGYMMRVYRPCGDYAIKWRVPREEANTLLLDWITGGKEGNMSVETDYTGCVQIPLPAADTGELFAQLDIMGDEPPPADLRARWREARILAAAQSEWRVLRAVEATYQNLTNQWKTNMENKFEKHLPSTTEYLVLFVKSKLTDRKSKLQREHAKRAEAMMSEIARNLELPTS
jgi:hypothetical protein